MNWQPGDLALCVSGRGPNEPRAEAIAGHKIPKRGGIYTVESFLYWDIYPALVLVGHHSRHGSRGWDAGCFVKVTPGTEIKGAEKDNRLPVKVIA
ncbi:hypothetical protein SAMN05660666_02519 [Novosphingobium aromaticivorans]|uniref:hypothetical protein n=1 Tax=Novosphingobium aromaticivorans TaxID=48935 RepID=UPI00087670B5|nr:hypothetical protein [Novosphingobium aromaticivorans]SCY69530.1 hypothetical protein SAMN05660666_02519 [Novosphingobium aromaticivorans]